VPDPMNRFSRWIHMFDSEIDWVSSILFGYWQFSVPRKISKTPDTFHRPANAGLWHDFHYLCFVSSLDISTALHQVSKSESNQRSKSTIFNHEYLKFKNQYYFHFWKQCQTYIFTKLENNISSQGLQKESVMGWRIRKIWKE
jgi:hypothetical protein